MTPLLSKVLDYARKEVGVKEIGRNRGERVEIYQACVGLQPGDPWCAAFVSWCFKQACHELATPLPIYPTGGALKMLSYSDPVSRTLEVRPGCIFVEDRGGGEGHVGLVETVEPDRMITIEGNAPDGVYRKRRPFTMANRGFIDVDLMAPIAGPGQ